MRTWFILHQNEPVGPYSLEELKLLVEKKDRVRKAGWIEWVIAEEVEEIKVACKDNSIASTLPRQKRKPVFAFLNRFTRRGK